MKADKNNESKSKIIKRKEEKYRKRIINGERKNKERKK